MTSDEALYELTAPGEGYTHPVDPRMNREPAGSLLLARAAAIRNAQEAALKKVAGPLIEAINPALVAAVEREILPRSSEFVHDRMVVAESRTETADQRGLYRVELRVVFDLRALKSELERFRRLKESPCGCLSRTQSTCGAPKGSSSAARSPRR
jgi:formaldehyde-activating enzyme involved in methanogenesis